MDKHKIISWLLESDVAVQYQVHRDLLSTDRKDLQERIAEEGWGAEFLSKRKPNGFWGRGFYQPKWTSTHYTLIDLRNLCIAPDTEIIQETVAKIARECKADDGGIYPKAKISDGCINGMFLNYSSYFKASPEDLRSVIDMQLREQMPDGGFNCRSNRSGAVHSSLHTTLSVLEGFTEYQKNHYSYRLAEVKKAIQASIQFILLHQLFISDRTGRIINKNFLRLSYPRRWRYDILSALDYFQYADCKWDSRMQPAIDYLAQKRNKNGTWNVQAKHPGQTHFDMEKAGKPSRWNTLRALRILKHFGMESNPLVIIVSGLPGSGKSYFAERLANSLNAEYINSDRLRKELFPKRSYSDAEKAKVYTIMLQKMNLATSQHRKVVLDATFYKQASRELFTKNAQGNICFIEVWADEHIIKERVKKSRPYSEADFKVYRLIQQAWEPIQGAHLRLESTNDNIDQMIEKATEYLNK